MTRLKKGMYENRAEHLFGLRNGQMHHLQTRLVHNGGWYNNHGEKIGWGDLSDKDFQRISRGLKTGEVFVVLGEVAATWNFTDSAPNKSITVGLKEESPGIDYVAMHAAYVITRKKMYVVDRYGTLKTRYEKINGLKFKIIISHDVKNLMTKGVIG